MEFLKKIKDKAPEYDSSFEELITKFTVVQGGRAGTASEGTTWEQGKYFSTKYEIYMYAVILGIKNDYRLQLKVEKEQKKFIEIKFWQPSDLAEYVIMSVIAKSNLDFNEIECIDEKEIDKEILNLKKLMEEYANGGFDKIRAKYESNPSFFENNENCFIDFLEE